MASTKIPNRRDFIKMAGLAGVGLGTAACATPANVATRNAPVAATAAASDAHASEQATAAAKAAAPAQQDHDMDGDHEKAVKAFLANAGKDEKFWKNKVTPKMDGNVKVFEITASEVTWEVMAGQKVTGMGYNGAVPGPEIRVTEGDTVRVVLTNKLKESTAIHFHGCLLPNKVDGVPFVTQPVVKPGETFAYEFVAKNPGSHMYHSHHNAAAQVTAGLMAPFIIEPKDKSKDPKYDSDYTIILNDTIGGFTLNGKGFPNTQPIVAKKGERIRVRYMNEGLMIHPMHLHGIEQLVFSKDGWNLPQPFYCDTLNVAPGERWDVIIEAHTEGVWAYHCHILTHAESPAGMFGMVTVLIVQ
ncbi:MAG: multicopper oxidase domain-containing protein [Thermoflexales bacterium]|nr:multicopper oxidase domain-containing protein [Thermoflexales bacterium]